MKKFFAVRSRYKPDTFQALIIGFPEVYLQTRTDHVKMYRFDHFHMVSFIVFCDAG